MPDGETHAVRPCQIARISITATERVMAKEPLVKRIVGPNPKEAGISGEEQVDGLKTRLSVATRVMLISAAVGAFCIWYLTR